MSIFLFFVLFLSVSSKDLKVHKSDSWCYDLEYVAKNDAEIYCADRFIPNQQVMCSFCEKFVQDAYEEIASNITYIDLEFELEKKCISRTASLPFCRYFINQYAHMIISLLRKDEGGKINANNTEKFHSICLKLLFCNMDFSCTLFDTEEGDSTTDCFGEMINIIIPIREIIFKYCKLFTGNSFDEVICYDRLLKNPLILYDLIKSNLLYRDFCCRIFLRGDYDISEVDDCTKCSVIITTIKDEFLGALWFEEFQQIAKKISSEILESSDLCYHENVSLLRRLFAIFTKYSSRNLLCGFLEYCDPEIFNRFIKKFKRGFIMTFPEDI